MARKFKKAAEQDDGTYKSPSTIDRPPRGEREPKEKPEKEAAPKQEALFPGEPVQPRPLQYDREVEFGLFLKITPPGKGTAVTLELYKGERAAGNVYETLLRSLISEKWEDNGEMIDALLRLPADMEGPSKGLLNHLREAMKDYDRMGAAAAREAREKAQAEWRAKQDELKAKREAEKKAEDAKAKEEKPADAEPKSPPAVDGVERHGFEEGNVQEELKTKKGKKKAAPEPEREAAEETTGELEVEPPEMEGDSGIGDFEPPPVDPMDDPDF